MLELVEQGVQVGNDDLTGPKMGHPVGREVLDEAREALRPGPQHGGQVPPGQGKFDRQPPVVIGARAAVLENQEEVRRPRAQGEGERLDPLVFGAIDVVGEAAEEGEAYRG